MGEFTEADIDRYAGIMLTHFSSGSVTWPNGKKAPRLDKANPDDFPWQEVLDGDGVTHAGWRGSWVGSKDGRGYIAAIEEMIARRDPLRGMKEATRQWALFKLAVNSGRHVLLHGRPGTGKSRAAFNIAKATQRRLDVINMRPNLPVDPLVGHYIPNKEGYFSFMYGVISMAMKEGGLLLTNEIDHATGDAESIMHFALDDPTVASVTLPKEDREIIRPAEGYQVIATMNGMAHEDLSGPIYSRFGCKVRIDFPNPDALKSLDKDLHQVAMADYRTVQMGRVIPDLRMLYAFQELRKDMEPKDAASLVFEKQGEEFLRSIAKAA
jgi:hypothetical protein